MPNQLPKNQNLSNLTSFRNEKHLNLLDHVPDFKESQEDRITNFILIISVFLGIAVSTVNYLNLTSAQNIELDTETQQSIEFIKSKETLNFELKKDIDYLQNYKTAKDSIKIKYGNFYQEMSDFLNEIGKPSIESLTFNHDSNYFKFQIVFFSTNQNIEEVISNFQEKNKKFSNLKMEKIEKLPNSKEIKYTFNGEIDGR